MLCLFVFATVNKNHHLFQSLSHVTVPVCHLSTHVGTFPIFSYCAAHIPPPVGSCRTQVRAILGPSTCGILQRSEGRLPSSLGPQVVVSTLRHWVPCLMCFFLAQPLSGDPNAVLFSAAALISCITGFGLIAVTLLLINLYKVEQEKCLWVFPYPQKITCNDFPARFEFLLLINVWHCLLV